MTERDALAGGDPDLVLHQVDPCGELSHRMFHLKPGVDLKEIKIPISIDQELDRPRILVPASSGQRHGGFAHPPAKFWRHKGRGGLFHHLLMAALQRTLPFSQIERIAGCIGQNLHLDVPRTDQIFLNEHGGIAE